MLKGLLAGGITMGVAAVFPEALVLPFFAGVLGLLSGVFPGLAMANPEVGRPGLEWTAAIAFLGLGLAGLWGSSALLAVAFLLHGLWSVLHQITALGDGIPDGYPGFSFAYSLVTAGFVAYMWAGGV